MDKRNLMMVSNAEMVTDATWRPVGRQAEWNGRRASGNAAARQRRTASYRGGIIGIVAGLIVTWPAAVAFGWSIFASGLVMTCWVALAWAIFGWVFAKVNQGKLLRNELRNITLVGVFAGIGSGVTGGCNLMRYYGVASSQTATECAMAAGIAAFLPLVLAGFLLILLLGQSPALRD